MEVPHTIAAPDGEPTANQKPGFWRRQFAAEATRSQIIFDVLYGVAGPVLCFVFDPIVFRSGFAGPPLLPQYQTFAYLFSGVQIVLLCFWLLSGPGSRGRNQLMAGGLLAGGLFCVIIGFVLLPLSVIGLMFGIGVFGFTPFLTALVYLRNAARAWHAGNREDANLARVLAALAGTFLVLALPLLLSILIHQVVSRSVTEIIQGDSPHAIFAAHRLMPLRFVAGAELDRIVEAYRSESNAQRKELLKSCYREITGENIEERLTRLD